MIGVCSGRVKKAIEDASLQGGGSGSAAKQIVIRTGFLAGECMLEKRGAENPPHTEAAGISASS